MTPCGSNVIVKIIFSETTSFLLPDLYFATICRHTALYTVLCFVCLRACLVFVCPCVCMYVCVYIGICKTSAFSGCGRRTMCKCKPQTDPIRRMQWNPNRLQHPRQRHAEAVAGCIYFAFRFCCLLFFLCANCISVSISSLSLSFFLRFFVISFVFHTTPPQSAAAHKPAAQQPPQVR